MLKKSSFKSRAGAKQVFVRILAPQDQTPLVRMEEGASTQVMDCLFQSATDTPAEFDIIFKSPAFENVLNDLTLSVLTQSQMNIALQHCLDASRKRWGYGIKNISGEAISDENIPIAPYCGVLSLCTEAQYKARHPSAEAPSLWKTYGLNKPEDVHKDMYFNWNQLKQDAKTKKWVKESDNSQQGVIRGWDHPFILIDTTDRGDLTPIVDQRSLGIFINHRCVNYNTQFLDVDLKIFLMNDNSVYIYKVIDEGESKGQALIYGPDNYRKMDPENGMPSANIKAYYLLAFPSIFSTQVIKPNEELTLNYGPNFVAVSPFLFSKIPQNAEKIPLDSDDEEEETALRKLQTNRETILRFFHEHPGKNPTYCFCEDCMLLEESERSVFCLEDE